MTILMYAGAYLAALTLLFLTMRRNRNRRPSAALPVDGEPLTFDEQLVFARCEIDYKSQKRGVLVTLAHALAGGKRSDHG